MTTDQDLIARALDGALTPEEAAAFDERVKREPALARSLLELARTDALLQDVAASCPAAPESRTHKGGVLTMAAVLIVSVTAFWAAFVRVPVQEPPPAAPKQDDGDRLRAAWPKLADAWRALDACKGDPTSDEYVKAMSRVHAAYEAAGWMDASLDYAPAALKQLFKLRQVEQGGSARRNGVAWSKTYGQSPSSVASLAGSFRKLRELKEKGLDDDDNVQDVMASIRTQTKQLGLTADDTPQWLRRRLVALARAIVLDEAYPEPAKATAAQAAKIRGLIADLAAGDIEGRDKAQRELAAIGEAAAPLLREALGHADKEVSGRAKKLLGVGHEPWKETRAGQDVNTPNSVAPVPGMLPPPPPPAPDTPK